MNDTRQEGPIATSLALRSLFEATYWISLSIVLCAIILLLCKVAYADSIGFSFFIQFVALATLATSIILLVGDLVGVMKVPTAVRSGILSSFVISVLGSSASVVAQAWSGSGSLEVKVKLLDEMQVRHMPDDVYCADRFSSRQSITFMEPKGNEFGVLAAIIIRNVKLGADQRPNITGHAMLVAPDGAGNLAAYEKLTPAAVQSMDYWKTTNPECPPKEFEKILSEVDVRKGDMLLLKYLTQINPSVLHDLTTARRGSVVVSVTDHVAGVAAESDPQDIYLQ